MAKLGTWVASVAFLQAARHITKRPSSRLVHVVGAAAVAVVPFYFTSKIWYDCAYYILKRALRITKLSVLHAHFRIGKSTSDQAREHPQAPLGLELC